MFVASADTQFKSGNAGRRKGVPNKATSETRKFFADFLEKNRADMQHDLEAVRTGHVVHDEATNKEGVTIKTARVVRQPDPARAIELLLSVAEFCLPKLQRVEWTGEDGEPLAPPVFNLGFKNGGPGGG